MRLVVFTFTFTFTFHPSYNNHINGSKSCSSSTGIYSTQDLQLIFSRFDPDAKAEIIRDPDTGDSLQYAFIEFETKEACNEAYFKMNNALIDDRRIKVDFSQSVAKEWNRYTQRKRMGGGRGGRGQYESGSNYNNSRQEYSNKANGEKKYYGGYRDDRNASMYKDQQRSSYDSGHFIDRERSDHHANDSRRQKRSQSSHEDDFSSSSGRRSRSLSQSDGDHRSNLDRKRKHRKRKNEKTSRSRHRHKSRDDDRDGRHHKKRKHKEHKHGRKNVHNDEDRESKRHRKKSSKRHKYSSSPKDRRSYSRDRDISRKRNRSRSR